MGRRKRRKRPTTTRKLSMPKVYQCPRCGYETLSISFKKIPDNPFYKLAIVKCGTCKLYLELEVPEFYKSLDVYGKVVDLAVEGKLDEEGEAVSEDEE